MLLRLKFFSNLSLWGASGIVLVIIFFVGGVVELIQTLIDNRFPSWGDISRNMVGGILAISASIVFNLSSLLYRWLASIALTGVLVIATSSFWLSLYDAHTAVKRFPLLAGFESRHELRCWLGNARIVRSQEQTRSGNYSGLIHFKPVKYSEARLRYFPKDWSGMSWLKFSVYSGSPSITLHFKVQDKLHKKDPRYKNRYNYKMELRQGWNDFQISVKDIKNGPKHRQMDMTQVESVGFFLVRQEQPVELYLDDVSLAE